MREKMPGFTQVIAYYKKEKHYAEEGVILK